MRKFTRRPTLLAVPVALLIACGGPDAGRDQGALSGSIGADGSSTVYPITEAMAEEFMREQSGVTVTVGQSGTGGGFKRFCAGETDISNASRPIKDTEAQLCQQNSVQFVEVPVAYDGLSIVVNPQNDFATCLTVAELKKIWEPGSKVTKWSDVRAGFPAQPIKLYGPGTASGTFDYFTEEITGATGASRPDYTASEDDNVLVQGVEGDRYSLGYFGYAYYVENQGRLKLLGVDAGAGCVTPTQETVKSLQYKPLSRPLFIYVSNKALARPEVGAFTRFYVEHAAELVPQVGYSPLDAAIYQENLGKLTSGSTTQQ
ncbi:MAG TPA: PstS family phosphate ABC transporter substrate-binding protein [Longimicrobiales bacterium]|nr:PstS family phosphate ABC transporter substrate-binding protein [Longimicrobiales bacterium]